jgi:hypothetical protein
MSDKATFLVLGPSDLIYGDDENAPLHKLLGRICPNPNDPTADWTPDDPSRFYDKPPSVAVSSDAEAFVSKTSDNILQAQLGEIVKINLERSSTKSFQISSQAIRTFKLNQQRHVLKAMWADKETQGKLIEAMKLEHIQYMVVGFKTCINAKIGRLQQTKLDGKIHASISDIIACASGATLPPWLQVMVDAGIDKEKTMVDIATVFGESVFAIRYRAVSRRNVIGTIFHGDGVKLSSKPISKVGKGGLVFGGENIEVEEDTDDDVESVDWTEEDRKANVDNFHFFPRNCGFEAAKDNRFAYLEV